MPRTSISAHMVWRTFSVRDSITRRTILGRILVLPHLLDLLAFATIQAPELLPDTTSIRSPCEMLQLLLHTILKPEQLGRGVVLTPTTTRT